MRATKQMSVTVTLDQARILQEKVASGEYASESEIIRDGLRLLAARDQAIEAWLRDQIVPEYDRVMAGEVELVSSDEARARLGLGRKGRA
jgi:putative addiction module CopG family antidote